MCCPKTIPELDFNLMKIYLFEAGPRILAGMSPYASEKSMKYLKDLDVVVKPGTAVKDFDGEIVDLEHTRIFGQERSYGRQGFRHEKLMEYQKNFMQEAIDCK
jgi:NADH dehydrogenase FAD-containing subunit